MKLRTRIGKRLPLIRRYYNQARKEARIISLGLRNGLWRSLSRGKPRQMLGQAILEWPVSIPNVTNATDFIDVAREHGLVVNEGRHAFYLPPQSGLENLLGPVVGRYPPNSGFKILRDFRDAESADYLAPDFKSKLHRDLMGRPRDLLRVAQYMALQGLGPRVWDVCTLRAGNFSATAYIVEHVCGEVPSPHACKEFLSRLTTVVKTTELRITAPDWINHGDFQCPSCNGNLIEHSSGEVRYVDFQNFALRSPRRVLEAVLDSDTAKLHFGTTSLFRGGRYLYQSIPGVSRAGRRDTSLRWSEIQRLLSSVGVALRDRLVLDIGCNAGVMLQHALTDGAGWGLGWDRPQVISTSRQIASALGFSRVTFVPADLHDAYDFMGDVPEWLKERLNGCVLLFLAIHAHIGIPRSLADIPWSVLVYEGHQREEIADAESLVSPYLGEGVVIGYRGWVRDGDSDRRPLLLLVREPRLVPQGADHEPGWVP